MKIAILTNFQEFNPGYSLTGIIQDQIRMLAKYGHEVHMWVGEVYHGDPPISEDEGINFHLQKKIPFSHLTDYTSVNKLTPDDRMLVHRIAGLFKEELKDFDVIFTHDFVFTGWFLIYGLAVQQASKELPNARWLHWIHSVPSSMRDWWNIADYGPKHKLVFPNETNRINVAEQYKGKPEHVRVIPHIKDLRSFADFHTDTIEFLNDYPNIMQADIVQILPASCDRLFAKRVDVVIKMFSEFKKMGMTVALVIANQWATTRQQKDDINKYLDIAEQVGLSKNREVIFTSLWQINPENNKGRYETGIPRRMLRELFMLSNVFIFPTREESFGLVVPEASLAGGCLLVLNKSLKMQMEISGFTSIYCEFGSFEQGHKVDNEEQYYKDLANITIARLHQSEALKAKTFMRKRYNWDYLYHNFYLPIMEESKRWA